MSEFFAQTRQALLCGNPVQKQRLVKALQNKVPSASEHEGQPAERLVEAGRPQLPLLVHPSEVKRRRLGSVEGRIALVHAIAHIEYNAINLALDAAYRFRHMPDQYYTDWLRVADDEARHFFMLSGRLQELGSYYGALTAHGGLWSMAVETDYDVMARMALVPRVLEARGLDVTPGMIKRLTELADHQTVNLLQQILHDEVAHVLIGNRWFAMLCEQRELQPQETFAKLLRRHGKIALRGPFNLAARRAAGFSDQELEEIAALEKQFALELES